MARRLIGALARRWWARHPLLSELRRRWPLIVGVLRGKVIVYGATITEEDGLLVDRDAVICDVAAPKAYLRAGNVHLVGRLTLGELKATSAHTNRLNLS